MSEQNPAPSPDDAAGNPGDASDDNAGTKIVVVGPDGMAMSAPPPKGNGDDGDEDREPQITDLVEQPAKVMRIGSMIRQLLDEVKAAPLDEASRVRLKEIHKSSIKELEAGLAPELIDELERLSLPFNEETPSDSELRIAQAQLVGWLEGLFHGIQTAIYAQQVAARAQLEQMRRALPPGMVPPEAVQAAQQAQEQASRRGAQPGRQGEDSSGRGGMYL